MNMEKIIELRIKEYNLRNTATPINKVNKISSENKNKDYKELNVISSQRHLKINNLMKEYFVL